MGDALPVLAWAFAWSTLYFILCLWNSKRSYEWHIRTVTTTHAILVSLLGVYSVFVVGPWPFDQSGGPSTSFQQHVIACSLGYFLLDLSWCLYFKTEGPVMLLHHSLSITGMSVSYVINYYGTELVCTIAGAEVTNPLLQLRWFMRETKTYNTPLGMAVDIAFMVLFGVIRIGLGSRLLIRYYQQDTDFLGRLGGTVIYSIGWVFWVSIVQYGYKKWKRLYSKEAISKKTKSNGVQEMEVNGNVQNGDVTQNGGDKNGIDVRKRNGFTKELVNGERVESN